ncbi:type II secretion system F family protein [Thalassoroseus pseudoceratinae]|uniref:type II secretion system F family protein n=1 Tax=Thalassoroseus pseudoceratinae TaxID=2713176 RepID=UPI00141F93E1|nr:type II secretion system F family protein [Thalassoroseus pseudoceratinae]
MVDAVNTYEKSSRGLTPRMPTEFRSAPASREKAAGVEVNNTDPAKQDQLPKSERSIGAENTPPSSGQQLPTRELVLVTTQLCILVRSGVDLAESIRSVSRRVKHARTRAALNELWREIENGLSFSEALHRQTHVFGPTFAATVTAGEASGQLSSVLNRLKELLRNELRLRNTVKSVLMYPAVLVCVGMMVIGAMVFFVLPQFTKVYQVMERPAPIFTQVLLDVGAFCRSWWWLLLPLIGLAGFAFWRFMQLPIAIRWRDRQLLTFRITARVVQNLLTGRAFTLMGTLLQSGVPLLEVIRLARSTVNNVMFHDLFDELQQEILAGRMTAPLMEHSICVPEGTAELISTAESSGDLGPVLQSIGEFYQEEGEQRLRDLVKVLEPAIIVSMGVVVAGVVLSIMLPLIKLTSVGGR